MQAWADGYDMGSIPWNTVRTGNFENDTDTAPSSTGDATITTGINGTFESHNGAAVNWAAIAIGYGYATMRIQVRFTDDITLMILVTGQNDPPYLDRPVAIWCCSKNIIASVTSPVIVDVSLTNPFFDGVNAATEAWLARQGSAIYTASGASMPGYSSMADFDAHISYHTLYGPLWAPTTVCSDAADPIP